MATKKKKTTKKPTERTVDPIPELQNTIINGHDRMARYQRHPPCPKCDARPSVCMMRRGKFAAYRCRQCGHRWEVK